MIAGTENIMHMNLILSSNVFYGMRTVDKEDTTYLTLLKKELLILDTILESI